MDGMKKATWSASTFFTSLTLLILILAILTILATCVSMLTFAFVCAQNYPQL